MSSYEDNLQPLNDIIEIHFKLSLQKNTSLLLEKYRNDFNKNPNFRNELVELAKEHTPVILAYLSNNYKSEILGSYYSPDGIVIFIVNELMNKFLKYYGDLLESINGDR